MKNSKLEELISSILFEPLAPLNEEERSALQQFKDCRSALSQVENEKRAVQCQRKREKNQSRAASAAMTVQEKVLFDNRKKRIKADLKSLTDMYSPHDLQERHDFEISKTIWTLIENFHGGDDWTIDRYTSRQSLEHNLFNILHVGGVVKEVFVNDHRLTKQERDKFLAPAIQEEKDHRDNSPFHQMFGI